MKKSTIGKKVFAVANRFYFHKKKTASQFHLQKHVFLGLYIYILKNPFHLGTKKKLI